MHTRTRFAIISAGLLFLACGDGHNGHGGEPEPTGSTCPSGSALTYENFGRDFMSRYCTECHASTLTAAQRQGSPGDHNFDTLEGIKSLRLEHIDSSAAAGPAAMNTSMPPEGKPAPTEDERKKLGEWLACGAP